VALVIFFFCISLNSNSLTQQPQSNEIKDYLQKCENKRKIKPDDNDIQLPQKLNKKSIKSLAKELIKAKSETTINCISDFFKPIGKDAVEPLIQILAQENNSYKSRSGAADALGKIGNDATTAIPYLRKLLEDNRLKLELRLSAAKALGNMGIYEKDAAIALGNALKDLKANNQVGIQAAEALGKIGNDEKASKEDIDNVISELIDGFKVKGQKESVRITIASALGSIGNNASKAIPILTNVAQDKYERDINVRKNSIEALGKIHHNSKKTVDNLLVIWRDSKNKPELRISISSALSNIGREAEDAITVLIDVLEDRDADSDLRNSVVDALGNINPNHKDVKNILTKTFKSANEPYTLRKKSAKALEKIDIPNKKVFSVLTQSIKDQNEPFEVQESAIKAIISIAKKYQDKVRDLDKSELDRVITKFKEVLYTMEKYHKDNGEDIQDLRRILSAFEDNKKNRISEIVFDLIKQQPWLLGLLGTGTYCIISFSISCFVLKFQPLALLRINDFLRPYTDFTLPFFQIKIPLRNILFFGIFNYHPKVLDAWVTKYKQSFEKEFSDKPTVKARRIHIPVPVYIDDNSIDELKPEDLRSKFKKQRDCLLIWGEAGDGKTSLACQIAKWSMSDDENKKLCEHPMLPVLIEDELDVETDKKDPLLEAIRGQIQDLADEKEPISDELLKHLLQQRRILVIIDRYSELSDDTRNLVRPHSASFTINALIVTSRFEEQFGNVTKTVIKPMRIEGGYLSSFMEAYLLRNKKRKLFKDKEFFNACSKLSTIVGEGRTVTILIAKLYIEQLIARKEGKLDGHSSKNLPDLMLSYLNEANKNLKQFDNPIIHKDAKAIAWECIKVGLRPGTARIEKISSILKGEDSKSRLEYLEKRLRIIQTINPAQDQIRFILDPLAEYLAGLYLIDIYNSNENEWRNFLERIEAISDSSNSIKTVEGFLRALQDCCIANNANRNNEKVPSFVIDELAKYTGLHIPGKTIN
jgi:hypothetical protein